MTMFSQVREMNLAFGNAFGNVTTKRLHSQIKNLQDEYEEFLKAVSTRNWVEVRDAACDILVFAFGAYHLMGVDYDKWREVNPFKKELKRPLEGDVFLHLEMLSKHFPPAYANLELHLETGSGSNHSGNYVLTQLDYIVSFALGIHALLGLDVEVDMTAVYESNMSKFCKTEAELDATFHKYTRLEILVYEFGDYPTKCVKSAIDQKDMNGANYPKDKFLKGVNYKAPVFA